jgi:GT2 family glycosyltransferase
LNKHLNKNELKSKEIEDIPKYTIIIAVTHSIDCLRECLKSLERLFHVVLINCHVINGLNSFFERGVKDYRCQITALSLPEQHGKHEAWLHEARLNEARNYAMDNVPGRHFVFTEDDCMFEPDWLKKFDRVLSDDLGAAGGPDILPEGMGWLPRALDCILNSFLGTAGAKRGDSGKNEWYYPRKENTVIPAKVIKLIGKFPEDMIFGAEIEMAKRIRDAGLQIKYMPDNPVWHWRVTTFRNLIRRNVYHAAEKVRLLRRQHAFVQSPHFIVFLAAAAGLFLGLLSIFSSYARSLFIAVTGLYLASVLFVATTSLIRTRSVSVGLGVLLLLPSHHLSIMTGVIKGAVSKITGPGELV